MKSNRSIHATAVIVTTLASVACGGGGTSTTATSTPAAPPASGTFSWVLKAEGPTSGLKKGLSLLHPSAPGTEWVIEVSSAAVSDARLVSAGTLDVAGLQATALKPYALVYIVGGDVRRVPLAANGAAPSSRVQRAQSTSACKFQVEANDYNTPENSRFIVSTAGADGTCGTADDGRAEVRLGTAGGVSFTPISGAAPLGVFRDVTTLSPRGWVYPKAVSYWDGGPGTTVVTRSAAEPAFAGLIASTYRAALLDDGTQLSLVDFPSGTVPVENRLDMATTGGGGWSSIGFDSNSHYVFRNGGTTAASTWTILKITRATPTATVLASGAGTINVASMGRALIYATVIGSSDNRLVSISKSGAPLRSEIGPSSTLTTVQTSANDVHELWRVTGIGTGSILYSIELIDETGATLYRSSAGGFPMAVADASSENFNSSESRTRFIFANGYGSRAFGDASLVSYDTASKTATVLGTLPGTTDFGTDFVYANAMGGPGSFMTGMVARSSGGTIQASGAKVFSYDATVSASLQFATATQ